MVFLGFNFVSYQNYLIENIPSSRTFLFDLLIQLIFWQLNITSHGFLIMIAMITIIKFSINLACEILGLHKYLTLSTITIIVIMTLTLWLQVWCDKLGKQIQVPLIRKYKPESQSYLQEFLWTLDILMKAPIDSFVYSFGESLYI